MLHKQKGKYKGDGCKSSGKIRNMHGGHLLEKIYTTYMYIVNLVDTNGSPNFESIDLHYSLNGYITFVEHNIGYKGTSSCFEGYA
jgi:hypothetical protein